MADLQNNRVMIFNNAVTKANGANADFVLGQPNFTSSALATNASTTPNAAAVVVDRVNNLLLEADVAGNRVLQFAASSTLPAPISHLDAQ